MSFFKDFDVELQKAVDTQRLAEQDYTEEFEYDILAAKFKAQGCPDDQINNKISSFRLNDACRKKNIETYAQLVEKSGVNKGSISQYINGLHVPSSTNAKKLADVLDVNPLWLMAFDAPRYYSGYAKSGDYEPLHEKIIERFDVLSEEGKDMVLRLLGIN